MQIRTRHVARQPKSKITTPTQARLRPGQTKGIKMKYYTLKFEPATVSEIKGSKAELIGELQNLIDRIEAMDEELTDEFDMVPLYDMTGTDYITATITGE